MATSLQLSLSSVPIVAIMERFNNKVIKQCMYSRKQTLIWQQKWMYSDASFDVAVVVVVVLLLLMPLLLMPLLLLLLLLFL